MAGRLPEIEAIAPKTFSLDVQRIIASYLYFDILRWAGNATFWEEYFFERNTIHSLNHFVNHEDATKDLEKIRNLIAFVYLPFMRKRYAKDFQFPNPFELIVPTQVHTFKTYQSFFNINRNLFECAINFFINAVEYYPREVPPITRLENTPPFFCGHADKGKYLDEEALIRATLNHICAIDPLFAGRLVANRLYHRRNERCVFVLTHLIEAGAVFKQHPDDFYAVNYAAYYFNPALETQLLQLVINSPHHNSDIELVNRDSKTKLTLIFGCGNKKWHENIEIQRQIIKRYDTTAVMEPTEEALYKELVEAKKSKEEKDQKNSVRVLKVAEVNVKLMLFSQRVREQIDSSPAARDRALTKVYDLILYTCRELLRADLSDAGKQAECFEEYRQLAEIVEQCQFLFVKITFSTGWLSSGTQQALYSPKACQALYLLQTQTCDFLEKVKNPDARKIYCAAVSTWFVFNEKQDHCRYGVSITPQSRLKSIMEATKEAERKSDASVVSSISAPVTQQMR